MRRLPWLAAVLAPLIVSCSGGAGSSSETVEITVAAASDVRPAFEALAPALESDEGVRVRYVFGSSGQLKEQILNGAPFDVYASANAAFVDEVVTAGRADGSTRIHYATGRLAIIARDGLAVPDDIRSLAEASYSRIAIANPDHAPYGVAAREAMESADVWSRVSSKVVRGDNVADAVRFVTSGNADAGVVALSLVLDRPHRVVPSDLHAPLRQTAVVTSAASDVEAAEKFMALVASPEAAKVFASFGFGPGGSR